MWSGRAARSTNLNFKARVCNGVQKHILLYWVKWSCYPESTEYIMYSEKGTETIRPLLQLQDKEKADQSVLFARIALIGQMPSCLVLPTPSSVPPSSSHTNVTFH